MDANHIAERQKIDGYLICQSALVLSSQLKLYSYLLFINILVFPHRPQNPEAILQ